MISLNALNGAETHTLSMRTAYAIIKDKMLSGSYLCLHDVVPVVHLHGLNAFYEEIVATGQWKVVLEDPSCYLAILRKW